MKSYLVHLMNKFFGCLVIPSKESISVFKLGVMGGNELLVHVRKGGGVVGCRKEYGAKYDFGLDEIPREACPYKLGVDGCIVKHDDFEARAKHATELVKKYGYVPSIVELNAFEADKEREEKIRYSHR